MTLHSPKTTLAALYATIASLAVAVAPVFGALAKLENPLTTLLHSAEVASRVVAGAQIGAIVLAAAGVSFAAAGRSILSAVDNPQPQHEPPPVAQADDESRPTASPVSDVHADVTSELDITSPREPKVTQPTQSAESASLQSSPATGSTSQTDASVSALSVESKENTMGFNLTTVENWALTTFKSQLVGADEKIIADLQAAKPELEAAAAAGGASVESLVVNAAVKAITTHVAFLAPFVPTFQPQVEAAIGALVANGATQVGTLVDELCAWLKKEEAYL